MKIVENEDTKNSQPTDYFSEIEPENDINKDDINKDKVNSKKNYNQSENKSSRIFTKQVKLEAPIIKAELNSINQKLSSMRTFFWIVLIISIAITFMKQLSLLFIGVIIWIIIGATTIGAIKRDLAEVKERYDRAKRNDDIRHDERVRIKERRRYL